MYAMKTILNAFSLEQDPQAIVWTCCMPFGATCTPKSAWFIGAANERIGISTYWLLTAFKTSEITVWMVSYGILQLNAIVKHIHTHTHTNPFNGPFPGLPRWAGTRKVKPIWILLKHETVSGSGISWTICKSAPCSRQITNTPPLSFYRPDALPAAQPTASKHWRHKLDT